MALSRLFSCTLLFSTLLVGCDASFEPYAETDRAFSVFGVLDVSDERHYVRIEPLQDDRPFNADSVIDATVTLTHLGADCEVTLEDTRLAIEGVKHNFRTDEMDLQLNESYRLAVQSSSDGNATTAAFTTPHEVPELSLSGRSLSATVEGGTEDRLLFFNVKYDTRVIEQTEQGVAYDKTFAVQYAQRASRTETGYSTFFDWKADVDSLYSGAEAIVILTEVDAQVGLVHPSAPDYDGLSREELFRPGAAPSNVEHGYGFVAGITNDGASVQFSLQEGPRTGVP